jgi:hypothetical protein
MKPTKPHAALAVLDEELDIANKRHDALVAELATAEARVTELCQLRAKIEKAISAPPPKPVADRPKRTRRTKAEMQAAREKTIAAVVAAEVTPTASQRMPDPHDFSDEEIMPASLRR